MGVRANFHILGAKWYILRPFSFFGISFTIEVIKVLGEQILENVSIALPDDSIALWTAELQECNAER